MQTMTLAIVGVIVFTKEVTAFLRLDYKMSRRKRFPFCSVTAAVPSRNRNVTCSIMLPFGKAYTKAAVDARSTCQICSVPSSQGTASLLQQNPGTTADCLCLDGLHLIAKTSSSALSFDDFCTHLKKSTTLYFMSKKRS